MRKKSSVGNGEGSVCNLSTGFPVTHTDNAKIWKTKRPISFISELSINVCDAKLSIFPQRSKNNHAKKT